jgi:hypothetical protein
MAAAGQYPLWRLPFAPLCRLALRAELSRPLPPLWHPLSWPRCGTPTERVELPLKRARRSMLARFLSTRSPLDAALNAHARSRRNVRLRRHGPHFSQILLNISLLQTLTLLQARPAIAQNPGGFLPRRPPMCLRALKPFHLSSLEAPRYPNCLHGANHPQILIDPSVRRLVPPRQRGLGRTLLLHLREVANEHSGVAWAGTAAPLR